VLDRIEQSLRNINAIFDNVNTLSFTGLVSNSQILAGANFSDARVFIAAARGGGLSWSFVRPDGLKKTRIMALPSREKP